MLLMYNYVLLKMSTWYSKHVEESNNIWRINNIQCITLVVLYDIIYFFCLFWTNVQSKRTTRAEPTVWETLVYRITVSIFVSLKSNEINASLSASPVYVHTSAIYTVCLIANKRLSQYLWTLLLINFKTLFIRPLADYFNKWQHIWWHYITYYS